MERTGAWNKDRKRRSHIRKNERHLETGKERNSGQPGAQPLASLGVPSLLKLTPPAYEASLGCALGGWDLFGEHCLFSQRHAPCLLPGEASEERRRTEMNGASLGLGEAVLGVEGKATRGPRSAALRHQAKEGTEF